MASKFSDVKIPKQSPAPNFLPFSFFIVPLNINIEYFPVCDFCFGSKLFIFPLDKNIFCHILSILFIIWLLKG